MAIDAKISAVTVISPSHCNACNMTGKDPNSNWDDCPSCHGATKENPKVILKLEPRCSGGIAGQSCLTIVNPPTLDHDLLSSLVGVEIWGNSSQIMIGKKVWAERIGYTKIKLI